MESMALVRRKRERKKKFEICGEFCDFRWSVMGSSLETITGEREDDEERWREKRYVGCGEVCRWSTAERRRRKRVGDGGFRPTVVGIDGRKWVGFVWL
ncbi:hypothetical protein HAX54_040294 [Datura stramonium]|uniref:Uncharacterized protein n=1 Tax=Datura stramonium TaxID=4076 RepID=A0ABS8VQI2_DATST|nr:hypothetical protein [Datura stramonium]